MGLWEKIKGALKQPDIERPGIIMLLAMPRNLTAREVEQALASIDSTSLVAAEGDHWIFIPDLFIEILQVPEPFRPKETWTDVNGDPVLRDALLAHRAFVSIAMEDSAPDAEIESTRKTIWKLAAKFANEDTLVMWDEASDLMSLPTPDFMASLSAAHAHTFELVTWDTICPHGGDDEQIAAAVALAQERFPALRLALEIGEVDSAIARTSFTDRNGSVEHLWFDVVSVGEDVVSGFLSSEPQILLELAVGSEVTVPIAQISDWMYVTADGRTVGGFLKELRR